MAKQEKKVWEALPTDEQLTLLENLDNDELAARFDKTVAFFEHVRAFFDSLPQQTVEPRAIPHNPPKDLIVSARRDLSFYEANFELIDNSIDKWRTDGAKRNLQIDIKYDLELLTGTFFDNAGGMDEGDVYKVFIPGETTNRDFSKNTIGSFGMGAKKGIFRLTDGAKVVSSTGTSFAATSEVPEKWESRPNWETLDGRAKPIGAGNTHIYFYKLFAPPTIDEIDELITRVGVTYRPLVAGSLLNRRVIIKINDVEVEAAADIEWSNPKGAGPRVYTFSQTFANFLQTGENITLDFHFKCGLTRKIPSLKEGKQPDWGVDVYGNGRLIEKFLKTEFGFGTSKLAKGTVGHQFFRGELLIAGHSFAIPWDTHKREYMHDHPVSTWLRQTLRTIVKAYADIGRNFAHETALRKSELETTSPKSAPVPEVKLNLKQPTSTPLPKWSFGPLSKRTSANAAGSKQKEESGSKAKLAAVEDNDERLVTLVLTPVEFDELLGRFGVGGEEELADEIRECLLSGVAFAISGAVLKKALKLFKCDGDVGQLSETIRDQFLKKMEASK
jgi:hypothetical protein